MYPRNIEEDLGFDRVKDHLAALCVSEGGKNHVRQMKWLRSKKPLEQRLTAVYELQKVLQNSSLYYPQIVELGSLIAQLSTKGSYLKAEEVHEFKQLINQILGLHKFVTSGLEDCPELLRLFFVKDHEALQVLSDKLHKLIDDEGELRPDASPTYSKLTAQINKIERGMLKKVNELYSRSSDQGLTAETSISIRDGRYVLPISAEHKRKVKGIVHDESKGGKIYYIEPLEILESTNQLKEAELERRREAIKLLKGLTKDLALESQALKQGERKLALYDFIKAKTIFAENISASKPKFGKHSNGFKLVNARHPLLHIKLAEDGEKVIPLNLELNDTQQMVVISGPNAGGKSVTLKTVALNQYMWQCGMLVACDPESEMALFDEMFIDIGDNQSIDNNLSSYSSHLKAMKHFINHADGNTLALIDELGSGTDPQFGGPIGEAVIEMLFEKGARGIITTHFSNIKTYAEKKEGIVNGAMAYDPEHLEPLYELQVGKPGSSFAFEVAKKIGLNRKLIQLAKKRSNLKQQKVDVLLATLEKEQKDIAEERLLLKHKTELANKLTADYEELKSEIKKQKADILERANQKALDIIKGANRDIEHIIRDIKEKQAEKKSTQKLRQKLDKKAKSLGAVKPEKSEPKKPSKLEVGDEVQLPGTANYGEIIEIRKNKATVMAGLIKSSFPLEMLVKAEGGRIKKESSNLSRSMDLVKKQSGFNSEIDLRGERTEDALRRLDEWIDTALVTGFTRLRVIHGKGHGILKDRIRMHLKGQPFVESIEYESIQLGGEGVSIITLK